jgi:hypothetical protein
VKLFATFLILFSFTSLAQTHTNRGGQGPDIDKPQSCPLLILKTVKDLQLKYLKIFHSKKLLRTIDKKEHVEKVFKELIQKQALELDLNLIADYKIPSCKSCLSYQKQLLVELLDIYERHQICPEFWKIEEDEIKWMKNIIIYGK